MSVGFTIRPAPEPEPTTHTTARDATMTMEREAVFFLCDNQRVFGSCPRYIHPTPLFLSFSLLFILLSFSFPSPPSSLASQGSDGVPTGYCTALTVASVEKDIAYSAAPIYGVRPQRAPYKMFVNFMDDPVAPHSPLRRLLVGALPLLQSPVTSAKVSSEPAAESTQSRFL